MWAAPAHCSGAASKPCLHKFSAPVLQVEQSKKCLRAGGSGFPEPSDLGNIEGQEQLRTEGLLVPWGKQQKSHCRTLESSY